jgi:hypothetical protein
MLLVHPMRVDIHQHTVPVPVPVPVPATGTGTAPTVSKTDLKILNAFCLQTSFTPCHSLGIYHIPTVHTNTADTVGVWHASDSAPVYAPFPSPPRQGQPTPSLSLLALRPSLRSSHPLIPRISTASPLQQTPTTCNKHMKTCATRRGGAVPAREPPSSESSETAPNHLRRSLQDAASRPQA